jgi:hypothetical protein
MHVTVYIHVRSLTEELQCDTLQVSEIKFPWQNIYCLWAAGKVTWSEDEVEGQKTG